MSGRSRDLLGPFQPQHADPWPESACAPDKCLCLDLHIPESPGLRVREQKENAGEGIGINALHT